jgi:EmrB/QacA subfamily drug resistance transporter
VRWVLEPDVPRSAKSGVNTVTTESTAARDSGPDPNRWKALAVTLAAGFMTLLDVSIVNVALPSIQHGLHASSAGVQWVVSGYALTFGLALVAGGRLGDLLGRRRMFLIALSAFVLTSAAAGAAPTEALLIVARLTQGLAAGMLTPQNTGLIQDLFRGAERGRAFGALGSTIGISTAAGPVIGGLILTAFGEADGWRWVFYVNVPIGIVALALAAKLVPPAPSRAVGLRKQIDFGGIALLGLAVLCVMLPIVQSQGGGSPLLWLLVVAGAGFGFWFVRWEWRTIRRGGAPLLDLRLFRESAGFATGLALGTIYFCGFSGIWLVMSLFFQNGLGYTPLESGLSVTPFAIGSSISALLAGRLVTRWGRWVTVAGLCLIGIGLVVVAVILLLTRGEHAGFAIAAPLFVAGVGGGAVISPNTTLTLACVPPGMGGAAGGALQTGQRIGTAIGTAVLASVLRHVATSHDRYPDAVTVALACTVGFILAALAIAIVDLRVTRDRTLTDEATEHASAA